MVSDNLQALALAFPIVITALVPNDAEACAYDPCTGQDFWHDIAAINAAKIPADGVLVLQGAHQGGVDADWLAMIELTVTKDGQPVAGALEATSMHGLLIWRPSAPWVPGATYQMSGELTNPDGGDYACAAATIPFAADLLIDAEPGAALGPVEFSATANTQSSPVVTLGTLVCCPGATPSESYGGCGGTYVNWDETACAPTSTHGYLTVEITGQPAATGPVASQVIYTLKVDGATHSVSQTPSFAVYGDKAFCAVVEAQELASGKVSLSDEQCFGEDMADVLGVHPLDPKQQLACTLQQCEVVNGMWDPMNCTPYDPENVPTTSDTMSSSDSDSGTPEDGGEKGCACQSAPANDAGLLALVAIVGLTRRRRGSTGR